MRRKPGLHDLASGQNGETALLLAMLDSTSAFWRRELRGLMRDELRWRTKKGGHTIGMLLLHIAVAEHWWVHMVAMGRKEDKALVKLLKADQTDQYKGKWPEPPDRPKEWFFKQCAQVRASTHEDLKGLDAANLRGRIGSREFTLRWILHHLIEHEAYHGGQMVLLRDLYRRSHLK